ncbi:hypothetical protein [Thermostilla marina]
MLLQNIEERIDPLRNAQSRHLDDQIITVAIDDQAAQSVAFAVDHACGAVRVVVTDHLS